MAPILQSKLDLAEALASPVPLGSVDVALVELDSESHAFVPNSQGKVEAVDIADTDYERLASVNTAWRRPLGQPAWVSGLPSSNPGSAFCRHFPCSI